MQSAELASGGQGYPENPAHCRMCLVLHVGRELSFWKSTLSEGSKGWLSPEILPHKGKKWPSFPGVIQEWAVKPKLNIHVRLQGLPKNPGWTCGFLHLHTRSHVVLSNAFQEAFATAMESAVGSAEGQRVVHPPRQLILPCPWVVPQSEWSLFSIWAAVPPLPLSKKRAPSSPLTLSRLTWAHTCAF